MKLTLFSRLIEVPILQENLARKTPAANQRISKCDPTKQHTCIHSKT
jgi:hypothetical protein